MTLTDLHQRYHRLEPQPFAGRTLYLKPGVRGYPEVHPGVRLLAKADLRAAHLLDATGSAAALALWALGQAERVTVLEPSRAALRCARETFWELPEVGLLAGAPWNAEARSFDAVCLIPATDRGNLRVRAELAGAQRALKPGGRLYAVMHKDQGAKRYEKELAGLFGEVEVIAKDGGWRLVRALEPQPGAAQTAPEPSFEAAGLMLGAEPGVYAALKLDPGTGFLLETYPLSGLGGKRVLDLGSGYGLLALKAALAGGEVTALDDDLSAVRSSHRNALRYGLDVRALHSDVDSELRPEERFDLVVTNPPFHLGKQVRRELPHAFIAAAKRVLKPGGELVLVANQALAYEPLLAQFSYWETLRAAGGFKVLRALA